MSIFDEMHDCIESARSTDTCEYSVYSEMFDLIAEAETENAKLREYAHSLEVANIDMASRLEDYIGQYDPTDAFVIEVKAKNAKLCELVTAQKLLVDAVHAYWAGGMNQEQFNVLMKITARVDRLCDEIGIGVDT